MRSSSSRIIHWLTSNSWFPSKHGWFVLVDLTFSRRMSRRRMSMYICTQCTHFLTNDLHQRLRQHLCDFTCQICMKPSHVGLCWATFGLLLELMKRIQPLIRTKSDHWSHGIPSAASTPQVNLAVRITSGAVCTSEAIPKPWPLAVNWDVNSQPPPWPNDPNLGMAMTDDTSPHDPWPIHVTRWALHRLLSKHLANLLLHQRPLEDLLRFSPTKVYSFKSKL